MRKLALFCKSVFHPGVHLYFALNWYLALHAGLSLLHFQDYNLNLGSPIAVVTFFIVLLYLRMVDEIKDLEYDKIFNPTRPLVKGDLSLKEVSFYLFLLGTGTLSLNLVFGISVWILLLVELIYGVLLIPLDKIKIIRENIIINLLMTYPVNILLSVYVFLLNLSIWQVEPHGKDYYLLASFSFAFLYYEFARKIKLPKNERAGERTYSQQLGFLPAMILALLLASAAAGLLILLFQTWLPFILIFPLLWGVWLIKIGKKMALSGTAFIGLYYGLMILLGLLARFEASFHLLIRP
jgi:hypothetical protein